MAEQVPEVTEIEAVYGLDGGCIAYMLTSSLPRRAVTRIGAIAL
jgi:hypothetical protein